MSKKLSILFIFSKFKAAFFTNNLLVELHFCVNILLLTTVQLLESTLMSFFALVMHVTKLVFRSLKSLQILVFYKETNGLEYHFC